MSQLFSKTLLALGISMAATALCSAPASAAETKKPVKAKAKAKTKVVDESSIKPATPEDEPDVAGSKVVEFNCELGATVTIYSNETDNAHVALRWKKRLHRLTRVGTTTGANRFENRNYGLIWIGIPAKGMLLDSRQNRQLANECKSLTEEAFVPQPPETMPTAVAAPATPTIETPSPAAVVGMPQAAPVGVILPNTPAAPAPAAVEPAAIAPALVAPAVVTPAVVAPAVVAPAVVAPAVVAPAVVAPAVVAPAVVAPAVVAPAVVAPAAVAPAVVAPAVVAPVTPPPAPVAPAPVAPQPTPAPAPAESTMKPLFLAPKTPPAAVTPAAEPAPATPPAQPNVFEPKVPAGPATPAAEPVETKPVVTEPEVKK
jgi:hypothetical protein